MEFEEIVILNEPLAFAKLAGRLKQLGNERGRTNNGMDFSIDMVKPEFINEYISLFAEPSSLPRIFPIDMDNFKHLLLRELNGVLAIADKKINYELVKSLFCNFEYEFKPYVVQAKLKFQENALFLLKTKKNYFLRLGWYD